VCTEKKEREKVNADEKKKGKQTEMCGKKREREEKVTY
jgi:hypothetical protein